MINANTAKLEVLRASHPTAPEVSADFFAKSL
jgi:hypothetical protein